ncbi:hypothetical protein [Amycolatopsis sp. cg9]|uniref:hypothetical protein n=1 Tax=Amycolatopsis sp. cg9 TaxID=3238801 RepID=UPI003524B2B7
MSTIQATAGAPAAVWVRVFHNNHAHDKFLRGYESGQTVTEVFTYTTRPQGDTHDHTLADEAFELFNIGDDPQFGTPDPRALDYRARRNRSLSIGDVLGIDGRFYSCDASGWRELPEAPPVKQITAPGTTPLY